KEIYDRCAELARDPANDIVNQFSEFGNYLAHYHCTGPALTAVFAHLRAGAPHLRLAAFVAASGSAGTPGAGHFLKERPGARIGVSKELLASLGFFGLSSLANMLGTIKLAKHLDLGPDDVLLTVATDDAALYRSELERYLKRRHNTGELSAEVAAEICGTYLI